MMSLQRNYYEVLGLPPGATTDQIKKKYRELARKFHPDVVQDKALGQRVFTQINQAYSVLGDPERRAQYNGTLQTDAAPNGSAKAPTAAAQAKSTEAPPKTAAAAPSAPSQPLSAAKIQAIAEMMSKAENAIMAGKPIEARAFCMRILEADPRHVRALEILGDALVQMGRRDEAAVQYRRALQVSPSTLIQAKLSRVSQAAPSAPPPIARPVPKAPLQNSSAPANGTANNGSRSNGNGTHKTNLPNSGETEKSGGLLGRLLGRK
ncbi:MAG: DnaJ domain-containing protein [Janthinobacterium lividum]